MSLNCDLHNFLCLMFSWFLIHFIYFISDIQNPGIFRTLSTSRMQCFSNIFDCIKLYQQPFINVSAIRCQLCLNLAMCQLPLNVSLYYYLFCSLPLDISATLYYRSSHQRCSVRKGILRNSIKSTEKHLYQSLFLNKGTLTQVLSFEFCETSKNLFSYRTPPGECFCYQCNDYCLLLGNVTSSPIN